MISSFPNDFHFLRPVWLLSLIPVLLLLLSFHLKRGRSSVWSRVVDPHLLRQLLVTHEGRARRWPTALLALGWIVAAIAMAGPAWKRLPQPTYTVQQPTVIALDLSRAMDSEDLKPSRLAQARYKIHDILDRLKGGQVGLVLYSDEPYVAVPLTDDSRVIEEMIPTLGTDLMPADGNRADRAVDQAVSLLEQAGAPTGHIVLITHGVGGDARRVKGSVERAAEVGFHVSVLAAATEDGAPVRDRRGRIFRDPAGAPILSRLDRDALESLAGFGDGVLATLSPDGSDLDALLAAAPGRSFASQARESEMKADVWQDAGASLVMMLVVLGALSFRRGWVVVVVLGFAALAAAPDTEAGVWDDLWVRRDRQGAIAFAEGRNAEAAAAFRRPDWKAAALYEDGQYETAVETLESIVGPDGTAAIENTYNLGNALARSGRLEEAIAAYDEVLDRRPDHEDASFNRDLVERLLEEREEQGRQCDRPGSDGEGDDDEKQQGPESNEEDQSAQSSRGDDASSASEDRGRRERDTRDPTDNGTETGGKPEQDPEEGYRGSSRDSPAHDAPENHEQARGRKASQEEKSSLTERLSRMVGMSDPREPVEEDSDVEEGAAAVRTDGPMTEEAQASEQMLRRVPQDPGGLLRVKIRRRYMERRYEND
jgi:Ca-activated chloride channel family protein